MDPAESSYSGGRRRTGGGEGLYIRVERSGSEMGCRGKQGGMPLVLASSRSNSKHDNRVACCDFLRLRSLCNCLVSNIQDICCFIVDKQAEGTTEVLDASTQSRPRQAHTHTHTPHIHIHTYTRTQ